MQEELSRFSWIIGEAAINKLASAHVAIIGVGGVGGSAVHALARAGVGHLSIFDHDYIEKSNINRQVVAYQSTIGRLKVDVLKEQINDINPLIKVDAYPLFVVEANYEDIPWDTFDFVIEGVDKITTKLLVIQKCIHKNIPIISAMGAGNRLDPSQLIICDIFKTKNDPLAKVMRYELKKRAISQLVVAASLELPTKQDDEAKRTPGSSPFVPNAMGLLIASYVTQALVKVSKKDESNRND